jgi:hypothetical protein
MIPQKTRPPRSHYFRLFILTAALAIALIACGSTESNNDDGDTSSDNDNAVADVADEAPSSPTGVEIVSTEAVFTVEDLVETKNFKKSKEYKVEGLDQATAAIYGFFGPDPYDRQEFEARFYPDHDTAITVGVDFADEATGPEAVIAKDIQRWDEGLVQRRACSGNVRGSHHSGKCDNAKYGDYVVAGNLVLLCQGKDSETSLANCNALMDALQAQ